MDVSGWSAHAFRAHTHAGQIKTMFSSVLVAMLESLPLGILQILYSQRIASKMELLDVLSLVTSWCAFDFAHNCSGHAQNCSLQRKTSKLKWLTREVGLLEFFV